VIQTLKRYDEYKDSGIQWLGELPNHWQLLSNKNIFKLKKNLVGKKSGDYTLLSLTLSGIIKRDMENPQGKFPAEFNTYQEVKTGDFVFCLFDVEETPRCVGLSAFEGMITGAYTVLEARSEYDKRFLYYFYLNLDSDKRLKPLYTGLRNTISKENFFSFKTFIPPLPEQTAIAAFLDRKTALIDKAIAIKQKQIELLKERRQILIQRAVTRGLDPNAKMKDSGVEWIGEIPEAWEVKRLKFFANIVLGKMLCTDKKVGFELKPYLKSKNIQWLKVDVSSVDEMWFSKEEMLEYRLKKGDLILSEGGEVGKTCMWNDELEECYIQNSAHKVSFKSDNSQEYYLYLFFTAGKLGVFDKIINKVSIGHLTKDKLVNLEIPCPPKSEQIEIVYRINDLVHKMNTAVLLKEKEIEKLSEYKATLINEVVTGKAKVY
jgi:type I restriction enzyme, S subunit